MKTFILSAIAATLAVGPIAATAAEAAPQRYQERTVVREGPRGRTVVTRTTNRGGNQYRNWRKGQRFDRRYARNYRQIDYRQYRGLRAPPRGYRYYQSGNDAVLASVATGVIAAVIAGAIR